MWVKRTEKEFKAERLRRRLNVYIFLFGLFILLISISTKIGWDKTTYSISPISWEEGIQDFPWILISSVLCVAMALVMQFDKWLAGIGGTALLICEKCGKAKLRDRFKECNCGGQFLDEIEMKWLEEGKTNEEV